MWSIATTVKYEYTQFTDSITKDVITSETTKQSAESKSKSYAAYFFYFFYFFYSLLQMLYLALSFLNPITNFFFLHFSRTLNS